MIRWIYNNAYLENQELLFYIAIAIIVLIILITIYLVRKELKNVHN